jgi:hypothetical protein
MIYRLAGLHSCSTLWVNLLGAVLHALILPRNHVSSNLPLLFFILIYSSHFISSSTFFSLLPLITNYCWTSNSHCLPLACLQPVSIHTFLIFYSSFLMQLSLLSWRWWQHIPLKHLYLPMNWHSITSQKTVIFIVPQWEPEISRFIKVQETDVCFCSIVETVSVK